MEKKFEAIPLSERVKISVWEKFIELNTIYESVLNDRAEHKESKLIEEFAAKFISLYYLVAPNFKNVNLLDAVQEMEQVIKLIYEDKENIYQLYNYFDIPTVIRTFSLMSNALFDFGITKMGYASEHLRR